MCGLICSSLGNLLQYRERYQEGYNSQARPSLHFTNRCCNTASGIRRATILKVAFVAPTNKAGCNTASGIRRATIRLIVVKKL